MESRGGTPEVDVKGEEVKGERGEEEKEEEAAAEEARVLLGGRTEGGWVLSRFALHAPELCARSGRGREDPPFSASAASCARARS